ncbi:hypothetical protein SAMN05444487_105120 [Marininema mesophilum]|uniref:Uncharacterized protein n=1 Tax=Marininema mesophilum TaxID=1048340 RepID=A0A1H2VIQ8_9BACL|nr:hypothetical protein [Marininema mesophilum]SDW68163.1 hypothetical protein SAMN05444487_105120 [Marininema mesophilum]
MTNRAAYDISSLLTSRQTSLERSYANPWELEGPVHRDWDVVSRASLVILWGLLVYPRLDPDMKKNGEPQVHLAHVRSMFAEHLGADEEWNRILNKLTRNDYIRCSEGCVYAGARLWTALDASRMYHLFRTSVLVRKMATEKSSNDNNG